MISINGEAIALLAALSNPAAAEHQKALHLRDVALSQSDESYTNLILNFGRILACPLYEENHPDTRTSFQNKDPTSAIQLDHDPTLWRQYRQMAGLLLKNSLLKPPFKSEAPVANVPKFRVKLVAEDSVKNELKEILLRCMTDSDSQIRSVAGSCIASCSVTSSQPGNSMFSLNEWREIISFITSCLQNQSSGENGVDGAFNALVKLCEDRPTLLDSEALGRPLNILVPLFLQYFEASKVKYRKYSLQCLNHLIEYLPGALIVNMNAFLAGLSKLSQDSDPAVRQQVCRAIVSILSIQADFVSPHIASIAEFMVVSTSDSDSSVALDACEFWLTFASLSDEACSFEMVQTVQSLLPRLIPILLNGMVYQNDKIEELLEQNIADENQSPDRLQDVAPIFHKSRHSKGEVSESEEDNSDDDNEWSLRKCSAASLDVLAGMYGPSAILPHLLPALQEGLTNNNLWVREASILALGAIAEGCQGEMEVHLTQLYSYLLSQLKEDLPQLRCIACWTICRYGEWIYEQGCQEQSPSAMIGNLVEELMLLLLNVNKSIQVASCSAFGRLVESCSELIVPFLEPIYKTIIKALSFYQTKSLLVLFDTVSVMADFIGQATGSINLPEIYIPPLVTFWQSHHDPLNQQLLPLMECLSCVAAVVGSNIQPWAVQIFDLCLVTIEKCRLKHVVSQNALDEIREEDYDHITCCADVIDGLVEGLGENFYGLVMGSQYGNQFITVLHSLCCDLVSSVRVSAFAVLGDLARKCPSIIEAALPEFLKEVVESIDPQHPNVCNNSTWALGEICVRCGKNATIIRPFVNDILSRLIPLVMGNAIDSNKSTIPGLTENAAATIGRLSRVDASFVKDDLPRFLSGWCEGLSCVADPNERHDAFEGLLLAIQCNPQAIMSSKNQAATVTAIIMSIVSWHVPKDEETGVAYITSEQLHGPYSFLPFPAIASDLGHSFQQLLHEIRRALGDEFWNNSLVMPQNVKRLLMEAYNLN